MEVTPAKVSPKDVFLHLLAIVALYASAISFLILIFKYIDILLPDKLQTGDYYGLQSAYSTIRLTISTLIVVFPVFILTSLYLDKLYRTNPEKRRIWVRKWLIYFTLFVTAIIIIGDLVTLVNGLLSGELTSRFLLKIITVFFVAGSVFGYYFTDIRKHKAE